MTDIVFVRHGETVWNAERRLQGHADSPLTLKGEKQARALGEALRDRGLLDGRSIRISPAGRTRATADLMGVEGEIDPRLREIGLGEWEGRLHHDVIAERPEYFEPDTHPMDWYWQAPAGEGFDAFAGRLDAAVAATEGPTLFVTHGIASLVMRARALGLAYDEWPDQPRGQGIAYHLHRGAIITIEP